MSGIILQGILAHFKHEERSTSQFSACPDLRKCALAHERLHFGFPLARSDLFIDCGVFRDTYTSTAPNEYPQAPCSDAAPNEYQQALYSDAAPLY